MHVPQATDAYVLGSYVDAMRRTRPAALASAALRLRSVAARRLFAYAMGAEIDELLAAARSGHALPLPLTGDNAMVMLELARVIALQGVTPTDATDGLALLDMVLQRLGPEALTPPHQGLHAQLAFQLGHRDRAAQLCRTYPEMPDLIAKALAADLANPFVTNGPRDHDGWLQALQQLLPPTDITLTGDEALSPLDRLTGTASSRACADPLISVIVTTYQPDHGLITAIRSLAQQSWQKIEILLVDDASPPAYEPILRQCVEMDDRVRLVKRDANGGTYRARNTGLALATGEYVTFQDADDWSHPLRLEHQAGPLLAEPALMATTVSALNATNRLVLTRPGRDLTVAIPTLVMLRREPVMRRLGFFDNVRKAGDTEYLRRLMAAFGDGAVSRLTDRAYSVHRVGVDSLSGVDFGPGWVHPARAAYWAAYGCWHKKIRAGRSRPYLPATLDTRPFAAPAYLRGEPSGGDPQVYDAIYAGDWRDDGATARAVVDEVLALARGGLRVGVLQLERLSAMSPGRTTVNDSLQELINCGTADQVLLADEVVTALTIVKSPDVLQFPPAAESNVRAARVAIVTAPEAAAYYEPATCAKAAGRLFTADPIWLPGEFVGDAEAVPAPPAGPRTTPAGFRATAGLPAVLDPARWRLRDRRLRRDAPVVGVHASRGGDDLPGSRDELLRVYPHTSTMDVRIMGSPEPLRAILGTWQRPANWVVYRHRDLTIRSFLYQLDFYVYFPSRPAGTPRGAGSDGRRLRDAAASVLGGHVGRRRGVLRAVGGAAGDRRLLRRSGAVSPAA